MSDDFEDVATPVTETFRALLLTSEDQSAKIYPVLGPGVTCGHWHKAVYGPYTEFSANEDPIVKWKLFYVPALGDEDVGVAGQWLIVSSLGPLQVLSDEAKIAKFGS